MIKKLKLPFLILILVICFCAYLYWVYFNVSRPQLVGWDEAGFIGVGNKFHQLIKNANRHEFWQLTKEEIFYPFFQGWFLGLVTQPFYYTIRLARLVSLMLLFPSLLLLWLLGTQIGKKNKTGIILFFFWFLTSPMVVYLYSIAMKEGLGLTLTLACLASYFWGKNKKNRWFYLLSGLAMTLATLTKYYYGLLLIMVFLFEAVIDLIFRKKIFKSDFWIDNYSLFFLPTIILGFWLLAIPGNWKEFIRNLQNVPDSYISRFSHLLYYPLELAFGYSLSWPLFLIVLVGFVYTLTTKLKDHQTRIPVVLFLLNFGLALKNPLKNQGRYLFTTVPFFFLVGSLGVGEIWEKLKIGKGKLVLGMIAPFLFFGLAIIIKDFLNFSQIVRANASRQVGGAIFYEQDFQKIDRFD